MKFVVLASLFTSVVSFHIPTPKAPVSKTALFAENGAASPKKILVLGGDGFCGWPTSLYLSYRGHDVVVVDNLSRRKIDLDLGCDSLTPIQSPEVRYMYSCNEVFPYVSSRAHGVAFGLVVSCI